MFNTTSEMQVRSSSKMFARNLDIPLGGIPVFGFRLSEVRRLYLQISGSAADGCTSG
jgi:hypothetical protein